MENVHFDRKASHSLSVVTVALVFQEEFGKEELKKLERLDEVMSDRFAKGEIKHSINFTLNEGSSHVPEPKFSGWRLDRPSPDDESLIDWQLEIESKRCAIRTFAYEKWEPFISTAIDILADLFERTDLTETAFEELGVQFIDRFHWNLTDGEYDLKKFFKPDSAIFSESIRKRNTPLWHLFQGWKEDVGDRSYIENINLSTIERADTPHRTEIVHVVRCVKSDKDGEGDKFDKKVVRELSGYAHDQNKKLLNDILSDETIKHIKLNE